MSGSKSDAYDKKSTLLSKRFLKETKQDSKQNPVVFANWLIEQKTKWSAPTWRLYKNAIIYLLQQNKTQDKGVNKAIQLLKNELSNNPERPCKVKVKSVRSGGGARFESRTSSNKFKSIPKAAKKNVFQALDSIKKNNHESLASFAKEWIDAGIITGLRPIEWKTVKIRGNTSDFYYSENNTQVLRMIVKSAKFSKKTNRTHGSTRTLIMNRLNQSDIVSILSFHDKLQTLVKHSGSFEKLKKSVGNVLLSANKKALSSTSKYITLYSARHQFVSNRKQMGEDPISLAAILGHGSIATAKNTYGRKNSGSGSGSMIVASEQDIQKVIKNTKPTIIKKLQESL